VLLLAGANANNGANCGRFYGNWNNSASNSNWNISALHLFMARETAQSANGPCPLAKITPQGRGIVGRKQPNRRAGERGNPVPKRKNGCFELVISEENCIAAVLDMLKSKNKPSPYARLNTRTKAQTKKIITRRIRAAARARDRARYFREHAEEIGKRVAAELKDGTWAPTSPNEKIIYDGIRGKVRKIKIPCLYDQVVHHAIIRVTAPEIMRRNYHYNCGSIPGAGQTRAVDAMKKWLGGKKPPKYALALDIAKFYDTCPHETVMAALRRMFKDRRFLVLHEKVLASMGDGLAIGFHPSHWYANAVLAPIDRAIKQTILPGCKMARYMDDIIVLHSNKRKLHRARLLIVSCLRQMGLALKSNWQVFPVKARGVAFLSYRFFPGYTLLRKPLMYRISRRMRSAGKSLTPHAAMAVMSHLGILDRCDSKRFRERHVYPHIDAKKCKGVIRYAASVCRALETAAAV